MKTVSKLKDNEPYSVVIAYKGRLIGENDLKYTIYTKDSSAIKKTDDKYELRIWLDVMGLEIGKMIDERYRLRNFNKKWSPRIWKVFGRTYKLRKRV